MPKRIPLEGKRYGMTVVKDYIGKGKYLCMCDCGKTFTAYGSNLIKNHHTSCGCKKLTDLTGKTFGCLKVIKRSENKARGKTTRVRWQCLCTRCNNIVDVYADCLVYGQTTSCGCLNKDKDMPQKIKDDYVDGTQISKIMSVPTASNKSGVVGVNWDKSRNKWQAGIRFKGHKYNLGRFDDFETACKVRKEAEEHIFGDFLGWLESQKKRRIKTNEKSNQRQSVLHRHSKGTWILVQHGEQKRLRLGLRNAVQNEIRAILPAL